MVNEFVMYVCVVYACICMYVVCVYVRVCVCVGEEKREKDREIKNKLRTANLC